MRLSSAVLAAVAALTAGAWADELFHPPVRIEADGKPIDVEVGHAAPLLADFDGDGVRDLLVGQFGGGKLWIFKNVGTNDAPRFGPGKLFKDGKPEGCVPAG